MSKENSESFEARTENKLQHKHNENVELRWKVVMQQKKIDHLEKQVEALKGICELVKENRELEIKNMEKAYRRLESQLEQKDTRIAELESKIDRLEKVVEMLRGACDKAMYESVTHHCAISHIKKALADCGKISRGE